VGGVMKERIILHIDCNNAFLSWTAVNMLHKGSKIDIRERYAVIGGDEAERRGIVLAKSMPCKKKGVVTAETLYSARRKCPYLEVYPPEFKVYKKYSDIMYTYLTNYSDKIERYSIDECFLDYTNSVEKYGDPIKIAYKIKNDIRDNFGFTVNVGVGNNKLLAKMASDFSKPDKVHTLFSNEVRDKMWPLNVDDLFMIGKASSKRLHELGINTIGELANTNIDYLMRYFKSMGKMMWEYANGIDNSEVETDRGNPKSISNSVVLPYDYSNIDSIRKVLRELSHETGKRLRAKKMYAPNVSIWIKFHDFSKASKQMTFDNLINSDEDIYQKACILFDKLWNTDSDKKIRALCVGVNNITDVYKVQLSIFNEKINVKNENENIRKAMDNIKKKYGDKAIDYADKRSN
jgi:DNA polymerase-4